MQMVQSNSGCGVVDDNEATKPLPESYDYLPTPQTSQGLRKRDFNRRSIMNPTNDRNVRLSYEFSSCNRGNIVSP